jgi:NAD-dependent deacetylase
MKIMVFTGAGISRESGIATFRDNNRLWANYRIEDVCTPEALARNRDGVIDFYNMHRREVLSKELNAAHRALVVGTALRRRGDHPEYRRPSRTGGKFAGHPLHSEIRKLCSSRDESRSHM